MTVLHAQTLVEHARRAREDVIQCLDTIAAPDHSNIWVCCECGAVATHVKD